MFAPCGALKRCGGAFLASKKAVGVILGNGSSTKVPMCEETRKPFLYRYTVHLYQGGSVSGAVASESVAEMH